MVQAVVLTVHRLHRFRGKNYVGDIAGFVDIVCDTSVCELVPNSNSEARKMIQVQRTNDGWVFCADSMQEVDQFFGEMGLRIIRHTDSTDLWLYGFVGGNPVYVQPLDKIAETIEGDEWVDWR